MLFMKCFFRDFIVTTNEQGRSGHSNKKILQNDSSLQFERSQGASLGPHPPSQGECPQEFRWAKRTIPSAETGFKCVPLMVITENKSTKVNDHV
jgi:hypothetical protein